MELSEQGFMSRTKNFFNVILIEKYHQFNLYHIIQIYKRKKKNHIGFNYSIKRILANIYNIINRNKLKFFNIFFF